MTARGHATTYGQVSRLAGRSGRGISIDLVIREHNVQFGGAEQEAGSDGADVTGQPETIHLHEVLAKARRPDQQGNAGRELAVDPHRAKTPRIHPGLAHDQKPALSPWRKRENVAGAALHDLRPEQSNAIVRRADPGAAHFPGAHWREPLMRAPY